MRSSSQEYVPRPNYHSASLRAIFLTRLPPQAFTIPTSPHLTTLPLQSFASSASPLAPFSALFVSLNAMYLPSISMPPAYDSSRGSQYARQGKVAELRQELNNGGKKDKNNSAKKIALKKIVANMTMSNNDMVALFPDIINCMQIPSLEIKKM